MHDELGGLRKSCINNLNIAVFSKENYYQVLRTSDQVNLTYVQYHGFS